MTDSGLIEMLTEDADWTVFIPENSAVNLLPVETLKSLREDKELFVSMYNF